MSTSSYSPETFRPLPFHDAVPRFQDGSDTPRAYLECSLEVIADREPAVTSTSWKCLALRCGNTQQAAEGYLHHYAVTMEDTASLGAWSAGLDGILLTWVDFADGIARFTDGVLPVLEARGLRLPHQSPGP